MDIRALTVHVCNGVIVQVDGLNDGEDFLYLPERWVDDGVMSREALDSMFENEPLVGGKVLVLHLKGDEVVRHRATFECSITVNILDDHEKFHESNLVSPED